jgi:hypothetical protein
MGSAWKGAVIDLPCFLPSRHDYNLTTTSYCFHVAQTSLAMSSADRTRIRLTAGSPQDAIDLTHIRMSVLPVETWSQIMSLLDLSDHAAALAKPFREIGRPCNSMKRLKLLFALDALFPKHYLCALCSRYAGLRKSNHVVANAF